MTESLAATCHDSVTAQHANVTCNSTLEVVKFNSLGLDGKYIVFHGGFQIWTPKSHILVEGYFEAGLVLTLGQVSPNCYQR